MRIYSYLREREYFQYCIYYVPHALFFYCVELSKEIIGKNRSLKKKKKIFKKACQFSGNSVNNFVRSSCEKKYIYI